MGSGADSPCQGEMSRSDKGGRVGDYEHEVLIWSRPRWRFAYFAAMGKVGRRPQAAKPLRTNRQAIIYPVRNYHKREKERGFSEWYIPLPPWASTWWRT